VVIDTFARAARGGAEVDAEIGTEVLQQLESWTRVAGNPAVLVVHHTRKSNSNDDVRKRLAAMLDAEAVRGSSAIVGAVRWVGMLAKVITEPDDQAKGCPRRCVVFEVAKVNGLADDAMPRQYLTTAEGGVLRRMNRNERVAFESVLKPQPGNGSRLTRSQPQTPSAADFEG
jgi:hypothetical protein